MVGDGRLDLTLRGDLLSPLDGAHFNLLTRHNFETSPSILLVFETITEVQ
jgi:hypothetical protein